MNKSKVREIIMAVHEGIDELSLMRDISCLIDGPRNQYRKTPS